MRTTTTDVVCLGNAIVDVIARCDDAFLATHGAPKGHMRLIDTPTMSALHAAMGEGLQISGGSAANTAVGIAALGGRASFIGKVATDAVGEIFASDIRNAGVAFNTKPHSGGEPTARSLILVTPDGQRTMNTYLGISPMLHSGDLDMAHIHDAQVLYLEGYLFDRDEAKAAFSHAASAMKAAGGEVALTLSDGFCVDRHRAEFKALIASHVDILFANEPEIMSLYETADFAQAALQAGADSKLAVLTRGAQGAVMVKSREQIAVPAVHVASVVDTTGAGDLFAAGFLYGHTHGLSLTDCGRLGCLAASEVITHLGARPQTDLKAMARAHGVLK